jgi:hypothetical protein
VTAPRLTQQRWRQQHMHLLLVRLLLLLLLLHHRRCRCYRCQFLCDM